MCARRNPENHARLLGPSNSAAGVAVWQGIYPKGQSRDEFEWARSLRATLTENGARAPDIVDAFERVFGRLISKSPMEVYENKAPFSPIAAEKLLDLIAEQWEGLRWHRDLALCLYRFSIAQIGSVDFLAFDAVTQTVVLIEVQLDREDCEVVDSLKVYLEACAAFPIPGISVEGVVVVTKFTVDVTTCALDYGIKLFRPITAPARTSGPQRPGNIRLSLERLHS